MNYARLNHILIPSTKEGRDRLRNTRISRLFLAPLSRTWFAMTDEGRGLLALSLIASLMGLDVVNGQNYLLWSLTFSLLVASLAVRPLFRLRGVRIEVEGPTRVSVGGEAVFRVSVANDGDRAHHSLRVRRPFLPWDGTWTGDRSALAEVAPGGRSSINVFARFVARGHHHIDPFGVGALAPLGLVVGPSIESRGTRFVVVPRVARVSRLEVPERPRHQPGGVAMASHTGESMELVGLRPYRAGDRIRDLHARSWARLRTPVVREYQQEYFSRIGVMLDRDGEAATEEQLDAAISLTAGVVEHFLRGESLIDLMVFGGPPVPVTIGRSLGGFEQALDRLADVLPGPRFDPAEAFGSVRGQLDRLSALVLVAPTWDERRRDFSLRVRKAGVGCRVLIVGTPASGSSADPHLTRIDPVAIERACRGADAGSAGIAL